MSAAASLATLPDDTPCYVPGVGEVTVGEIVEARTEQEPAVDDEPEATLRMWRYLATHPHEKPWLENSGPTPAGSGA